MVDRSVRVTLRAVTAQYQQSMAQAGQSTTKFAKDAAAATGRTAKSLQGVQTEATITGGALLGIGIAAVAASTTFDKQMSAVQAASKASAQQLDALRQSALKAGADTAFSATEAAQGQEELAKAGLSTADILGGALKGSLDLAAAGAISVADSSEIAATALKVFGLRGNEVGHVADLLAAGAGKAQGGVNDLGMALKQSALVADQTGLSIEDTVGALAQFASAGLLGSDAGTSFKAMLQRLTPQSKEAADLMDSLGLRAYDASGQFIGLEAYAGKLRAQLGKLAPEQRNAALQTLFGSDAIRAASILYNDGAEGVKQWRDNVNDAGYAAEQASTRLDNLAGDLEKLSGTIETDFIKGGSSVNGILRFMTQRLDDAAQAAGDLPEPVLGAGVAAATAAGGFLLLAPRLVASHEALSLVATSSPKAAAGLAMVGKAAGGVLILTAAYEALSVGAEKFNDAIGMGSRDSGEWARRLRDDTGNALVDLSEDFQLAGSGWAQFADVLGGDFGKQNINRAKQNIEQLDIALADMVASGETKRAASIVAFFGDNIGDTAETLPGYTAALGAAGGAAGAAVDPTADLASETGKVETAAEKAESALKTLQNTLNGLLGTQLDADEATANLEASFDDAKKAIKDNGKTLDLHTPKGRANAAALRAIAKDASDAALAYAENGDGAAVVERKTERARKKFIETAIAMGASRTEAKLLADKYGLIPKEVATAVAVYGINDATTQADALAKKLNDLRVPVGIHITVTRDGDLIGRGTGGGVPPKAPAKKKAASTPAGATKTRTSGSPVADASGAGFASTGAVYVSGGSTATYQVAVTAAPGERAEETVPRALRRQAFLNGMGG